MTEAEVRQLRDAVFGEPSSDNNWNACKERWLRPDSIEWLVEQATNDEKRQCNSPPNNPQS